MTIIPSLISQSDPIPGLPTIPPVDYTSRDYTSILNDMIILIPTLLPEWTDRAPGDFGIVMMELFAYMGDILNYYIDRIANESFLATAQQRQSVLNIAQLLDYTPYGNVAASTNLQFTIPNPSGPVVIPQGTQVSTTLTGTTATVFQTSLPLTVFGDGISTPLDFTSNGNANQAFPLPNPTNWPYPNPAYDGLTETVTVGGVTWTRAPGNTFTGVAGTATNYIVINGNTVLFGNGTNGAKPSTGAAIHIVYRPAPPAQYQALVSATHGMSVVGEVMGLSTGVPGQSFRLFQTPVVQNSITVRVDEGTGPSSWIYYQRLVDAFNTDLAYTSAVDANGIVTITFGDGINGRIPIPGSQISADYSVGGGSIGNVAANTLTVSSVTGITGVTNPTPATGGADAETLDHIRIHAPLSITAINRAVALDDYAALVLNVPTVAKAAAFATYYNAVNIYIHPAGGFTDATTLAAMVQALIPLITNSSWNGYLDDKKMATVSIQVLAPQYNNGTVLTTGYVPVDVVVSVNVLAQYHQSTVKAQVQAAIQNLFKFDVVDFGSRISLSSLYHMIQEVEGVDYVNVTTLCRHELTPALGDVACLAYEIPQLNGTPTINVAGGITY